MTLALYGKSRARRCALVLCALLTVVAATFVGGVLPGAQRGGAAAYTTASYAGSASSSNGHWTSPTKATGGQDNQPAITTTGSKVMVLGNYVFGAVDVTAQITGLEVRVRGLASYAGAPLNVSLSWDGGTNWTTSTAITDLTSTYNVRIAGSSSTNWGRTWAPAELAWLRVRLESGANRTYNVDFVQVVVHYDLLITRTVSIVKVVDGANAPAVTFDGTITGASTSLTWQTTGAGTVTKPGVAAEALTVTETSSLSGRWSFGGYALAASAAECSSATFSGAQASGVAVPATGDQTVCIKNIYTPPDPTVTIAKAHSGNGPFAPGDTFDWVITATVTDGPTNAGVTITDTIPPGFTVNSLAVSDPHNDPDRLSCGTLDPLSCTLAAGAATGSGYTITLEVTVQAGDACGRITNTASIGGGGTAENTVTILCGGDPTIEKSDATVADGKLHWTITITNPAEYGQDVPVTDSDPSAVAVSSTCDETVSGAGPWTCGVPAKGSATITVVTDLPISPDVCTDHTITNTASIVGATGAGSSDSGIYAIGAVADASCLSVKKENVGNGEWTITFVNSGPEAADVSLTETYTAAGADKITAVAGGGVACTGTGAGRDCTLDLHPGETVVHVSTTPLTPMCKSQDVDNSIAATFDGQAVPTAAGDSLQASFSLKGEPSLCPGTIRIVKTDHTTPATPGRPPAWTVVLSGPSGETRGVPVNPGDEPRETTVEIPGAAAGEYSIAEAEAGPGVCPTAPGSAASWGTAISQSPLRLEPGGEITFTITNFPCDAVAGRGALVIEKVEDRNGNGVRDPGESLVEWEVEVSGPEPGFENGKLVTLPGGELALGGLVAGYYTVREATGAAGYRSASPATVVVEVPNGGQAIARFHNQPLVNVTARKTEIHLAGSSAGQGWRMTISGCGFTGTQATGPDGTVTWTGLALCSYTVFEDPTSKPGYLAAGPVSQLVNATEPGRTYTVSFANYRQVTIPECAIACEPVTPGGGALPASTPSAVTSPAPATTPGPVETVAGAATPGSNQGSAGAKPTPIAPATGTGTVAKQGRSPAGLILLGAGLTAALAACAFLRRRQAATGRRHLL